MLMPPPMTASTSPVMPIVPQSGYRTVKNSMFRW